ncbi:tRNA1(Val) (adenine(37)-N6)-methyltransferase [Thermoflexibacter ruber]|uniref:tRNA1(Val) (adenine(37)-N6)-methyltransferase n=1 Tax=Thermoflexibacter ruber TaxID=1003 RepID=A0A1I2HDI5_9BACT|nr:methyltransferase [Thermoflexibacter ruber]SFF27659.1 tRNA1Val (adenine37-N6)-methyltransferase [Thermoflexibacter ruber]
MPNTYFQFKQFRIEQANCAMKVSTDACILGAYVAKNYAQSPRTILDIGAGTGVLSLMLAQASQANITAIEIDEKSFLQAKSNFANSTWTDRLHIFYQSFQEYFNAFSPTLSYDLLICNPPFFVNSLKSEKKEKNLARHTDSLPFEDLLIGAEKLTHQGSLFVVLLPIRESEIFENILQDFYLQSAYLQVIEKLFISDNPSKQPHRVILTLKKSSQNYDSKIITKLLTIKDATDAYTSDFVDLMKDYYLYL